MNQFRKIFCLTLMAFGLSASADPYINTPNAANLLEHLVRHSDELLTETNLTRANQFLILDPVVANIREQGGWAGGFYGRLMVDPTMVVEPGAKPHIPEYFIGKIVNDFRMQTILLYDHWYRARGPSPAFAAQFQVTDYAYTNAMAATYFYIEALRRSYIIRGATGQCWNQQLLLRRLTVLERLAWEVRELMLSVRYATTFQLPLRRACLECTYRPYRVNVAVDVAQNFVPFPFYHDNRVWNVEAVQPIRANQPVQTSYDAGYWNQRFNYMQNSYINGYQPNLPADYNQHPYTPVQGGGQGQIQGGGPQVGGQPGQLPVQGGGQQYPQQGGQQQYPQQVGQQFGGQIPQQGGGQQPVQQGQGQQDPLGQQQGGVQQQQPPVAQQPGTQPGYPVQGQQGGPATQNGDVVPSQDYSYN